MKKLLSILALAVLTFTLAACGEEKGPDPVDPGPTVQKINLKVWGPQEDQALLKKMVDGFIESQKGNNKEFNITFGVVGEGDAKTKFLEDPNAAADVFSFAHDQLFDLVNAGGLGKVTRNADKIKSANISTSIEAASVDGQLYAYPMTADNGYFMYYDKSFFTEQDILSLDTMLEKAEKAGKFVNFDLANSWYAASFFLGNGVRMNLETADFNGPKGVEAGEAFKAVTAHKGFIPGNGDVMKGGLGKTIVAGISGTWDAGAVKELLGENYGTAKLPSVKMNGKDVQLGSFAGFKHVGVNALTKHPVEAYDLAEWLTNEENQLLRYKERFAGPSNINAQKDPGLKEDLALVALNEQAPYAVVQNDVPGTYWGAAEAFGNDMINKKYSGTMKEILDSMMAQIYS